MTENDVLEEINITKLNVKSIIFMSFHMKHLTKLHLTGSIILDDAAEISLPNLRDMNILVNRHNSLTIVNVLEQSIELRILKLRFDHNCEHVLNSVKSLTNLDSLIMKVDYFNYNGHLMYIDNFTEIFTRLTKLTTLKLLKFHIEDVRTKIKLPLLETLEITKFNNTGNMEITKLVCPKISKLILHERIRVLKPLDIMNGERLNILSINYAENIVSNLRNVEILTLFEPVLNDDFLRVLESMTNLRKVVLIDINKITNELINTLNNLKWLNRIYIRAINIGQSNITESININQTYRMTTTMKQTTITTINNSITLNGIIDKLNNNKSLKMFDEILKSYGVESIRYLIGNLSFTINDIHLEDILTKPNSYTISRVLIDNTIFNYIDVKIYLINGNYEYVIIWYEFKKHEDLNRYYNKTVKVVQFEEMALERIYNGDFRVFVENGFELTERHINIISSILMYNVISIYVKYYVWKRSNTYIYVMYDGFKYSTLYRVIRNDVEITI